LSAELVQAVLADWHTAPIGEKLRLTLGLLEQVTLSPAQVSSSDVLPLLEAGISEQAVEDALLVCACFTIIARVADALDVFIPSDEGFAQNAEALLTRGYI
jgi:alkylhydroperoxidase family enzyme